jgi:hypothetical protein
MNSRDGGVLETILQLVNDWLKFAEAKNAVLLTLLGTALVTFINYTQCSFSHSVYFTIYCYNVVAFGVAAILVTLFSFLPQTRMFWQWESRQPGRRPNVYFYGDLAYMTPEDVVTETKPDLVETDREYFIAICLAQQIVTNSRIAQRKYNYFRIGLWLALSAFLTPVLSLILYVIADPHRGMSVESRA